MVGSINGHEKGIAVTERWKRTSWGSLERKAWAFQEADNFSYLFKVPHPLETIVVRACMSFIVHLLLKTQNFSFSMKGPTTASQQQSYLATAWGYPNFYSFQRKQQDKSSLKQDG